MCVTLSSLSKQQVYDETGKLKTSRQISVAYL